MKINDDIKQLSDAGLLSILNHADHVNVFGDETREELEHVLQLNINDGLIDEIEILIVLSGE